MAICNGCGGVVWRDCFNPIECERISMQYTNETSGHQIELLESHIEALEFQVSVLTKILIDNGISVPDFSEEPKAINERNRDPFNNEPLPF